MVNGPEVDGRLAASDAIGRLAGLVALGLRRAEVVESASNPMTGKRDWEDRSTVSAGEQVRAALREAADEVERIPAAIADGGSGHGVLSVWTQTIFKGFVGKFVSPGWLAVHGTAEALSGGHLLQQALDAYRADNLPLALRCAQAGIDRLAPAR